LVTNQSAVTSDLRHAVPLLHHGRGWTLATLFGPEHGIWGEAQDMEHIEHSTDPLTGLTVYSLYGRSEKDLAPRRELLRQLDALVIDLQDIGSRYYTFIYTMALCMREAAPLGVQVIVLDRPNPIDGVHLEGNLSEGRGTTHPFELFGAPWLDPFKLADRLNHVGLPGVCFRPHYFLPTFQKHAGKVCGGAELHVTNRALFEPYRTGLWCVKVAR